MMKKIVFVLLLLCIFFPTLHHAEAFNCRSGQVCIVVGEDYSSASENNPDDYVVITKVSASGNFLANTGKYYVANGGLGAKTLEVYKWTQSSSSYVLYDTYKSGKWTGSLGTIEANTTFQIYFEGWNGSTNVVLLIGEPSAPTPASSSVEANIEYVFIYPQDEIGEYYLNDDREKEYISYRSNDICLKFMGSESVCAKYLP